MNIFESIKPYKIQILCVLAGFLLYALAMTFGETKEDSELRFITRSGYGSSATHEVYVSGLTEEDTLLEIPVNARRFSDGEIDAAFDRCAAELQTEILGKNASLQDVSSDLELPLRKDEYGFTLDWHSENPEILSYDGTVKNEDLEEPVEMMLALKLSDGSRSSEYLLPVTVTPKKRTETEEKMKRFFAELQSRDESASTEDKIELPEEFEGKKIRYYGSGETDYNFLWIAGILIAVLLFFREKQNAKEEQDKKLQQMQIDYPEIVSKLMVFIGAGISVRAAWEAIAQDYEKSGTKPRAVYEEIRTMCSRLKTGASEAVVYRDFGRACKSKQYMKLASLLEQNRKSGAADLKAILSVEMVEAWEERKNLARRQGEQASTKLLLPLVMMLGIVMVMIMVPAFMSF